MEPAVRLKFTKVKSWFLFAYLRALPGKLKPYEVGEHTTFIKYVHFDVCYAQMAWWRSCGKKEGGEGDGAKKDHETR